MQGSDNAGIQPLLQIHAHECDIQLIKSQYHVIHIADKLSCSKTKLYINSHEWNSNCHLIQNYRNTLYNIFKTIEGL